MKTLDRAFATQEEKLEEAADSILDTLKAGKMVYTFGTGHGHLLALEIFYRAGGMARVCPVLDEKLMLHISAAGSTQEERKEEWVDELLRPHGRRRHAPDLFQFGQECSPRGAGRGSTKAGHKGDCPDESPAFILGLQPLATRTPSL